jgi:hypothetical protein
MPNATVSRSHDLLVIAVAFELDVSGWSVQAHSAALL